MPPEPGAAEGREAMFKLWIEGGFGSERFGRLRCVLTHANLQPAVACYRCRPGDSIWRALALEVLAMLDLRRVGFEWKEITQALNTTDCAVRAEFSREVKKARIASTPKTEPQVPGGCPKAAE